jgi:hypothetical protein
MVERFKGNCLRTLKVLWDLRRQTPRVVCMRRGRGTSAASR